MILLGVLEHAQHRKCLIHDSRILIMWLLTCLSFVARILCMLNLVTESAKLCTLHSCTAEDGHCQAGQPMDLAYP